MYDVVIVGGGPAGITLALELAQAELRIALIESGGEDFDPDTQELYEGEIVGHDIVDLMAMRLRMLGGTTNHWGGFCVPLDPIDFDRRPLSGLSGWPFDRAHLDPFYRRAHDYLRLGSFDYGRDIVSGLGDRNFLLAHEPRIESTPVRHSRGPLRFGDTYREELEASPAIDLMLWSNMVGLEVDGDDRINAVQVAHLDGTTRRIEGRVVVLACGAVENARLLMLANAANGRSFGDAGDLLGKCYMDHPASGAGWLTFTSPVSARAYWQRHDAPGRVPVSYVWRLADRVLEDEGLVNAQFYLIPVIDDPHARQLRSEARQADRALRSIAKWALLRPDRGFQLSEEYCRFISNADSFALHKLEPLIGEGTERVLLKFESEELPDRHNRITLSDERDALGLPRPVLHWTPGSVERDSMIRTTTLIGQICGEHGLGRVELEDYDRPHWGTTTSWHQIGTTRMAVSPTDGVVDADARVHGTRNLYMAGGSVMPTNGRANPTLTIVALTVRLADHLKQEVAAL